MANSITSHFSDYIQVHTNVGENGRPMAYLRKGANETTPATAGYFIIFL
jgi:hypothetical protein